MSYSENGGRFGLLATHHSLLENELGWGFVQIEIGKIT